MPCAVPSSNAGSRCLHCQQGTTDLDRKAIVGIEAELARNPNCAVQLISVPEGPEDVVVLWPPLSIVEARFSFVARFGVYFVPVVHHREARMSWCFRRHFIGAIWHEKTRTSKIKCDMVRILSNGTR